VTLGPSEKAKFYPLTCGSNEEFASNCEKLFPTEKKAIEEFMKLLKVKLGSHICGRDWY